MAALWCTCCAGMFLTCDLLPSCKLIAIWIVVLLGLVEKVNINETSDFR
jgi:hypothetical protein